MAFPVLESPVLTHGTSAGTSHVVNLPNGIVSGDLLIVLIRCAVAGSFTWPDATWNVFFDGSPDAADDQMAMAWRKADGTEGSTITVTSGNGKFAAISLRISGAADPTSQAPELSTVATGSSTTPDPTTCTPTGGAKDYLWVWLGGWAGEQTSPPDGNPTNYSTPVGANSGTAGATTTNCRVAMAFRSNNASSEDPGSWTISVTDAWTAYCMAVHPAPPSAPQAATDDWSSDLLGAPRVAMAGALATAALAATIGCGLANAVQDSPSVMPAVEDYWHNPNTARPERPRFERPVGPSLAGTGPPPEFIPSEDFYQPPVPWPIIQPIPVIQDYDYAPLAFIDDYWQATTPWETATPIRQAVDDDYVPPSPEFTPDEDYWQWQPRSDILPHFQRSNGPALSGQGPSYPLLEGAWQPPRPWPTGSVQPRVQDEDYASPPAAFTSDEGEPPLQPCWPQPESAPRAFSDTDEVSPLAPLFVDEGAWRQPPPWPVTQPTASANQDDYVPPPAGAVLDEDYWQLPRPPAPRPRFERPVGPALSSQGPPLSPVIVDEDSGPGIALPVSWPASTVWVSIHDTQAAGTAFGDDSWPLPAPWPIPIPRVLLGQDEDYVQVVTPVIVDEDYWRAPPPTQASLWQPLPLGDPEEIPAGSLHLQPDEDFWKNWVAPVTPWTWIGALSSDEVPFTAPPDDTRPPACLPPWPAPRETNPVAVFPPWLGEMHERVTPPSPGPPNEDYWQNQAAPAPGFMRVTLPLGDPEEIPAGSLVALAFGFSKMHHVRLDGQDGSHRDMNAFGEGTHRPGDGATTGVHRKIDAQEE